MTDPATAPPRPDPGKRPTVVLDTAPRTTDQLLTPSTRGLPPVRLQVAARELVGRYRHRPVV